MGDTQFGILSTRSRQLFICALALAAQACSSKPSLPGTSAQLPASAGGSVLATHLSFQTDQAIALNYAPSAASSPIQSVQDPNGLISLAGPAPSTGTFSLKVTDAPVAGMSSINVTFSRIEMRNQDTGVVFVISSTPVTVDLLQLQNGLAQVFSNIQVPAGSYHQLRFFITAVVVGMNGTQVNVAVPAELTNEGLRIWGSITVQSGGNATATIDFDTSKMFVYSDGGVVFRPVAKLRSLHFVPAGIHFEQQADGSISLIGPPGTIREEAWMQLTDASGVPVRQRALEDGSFRFDNVDKVYGSVELAVVKKQSERSQDKQDKQDQKDEEGSNRATWIKLAWIDLTLDFVVDARFPRILASSLNSLFNAAWIASGSNPSAFLGSFTSDPFKFLAGKYVEALGKALPAGFTYPALSTPYPFALEGPDYELPQYTFSMNSVGFFSGGPSSGGCSDARVVFEGPSPSNDYGALDANSAVDRMILAGLPFTGLLAEYEAVCRGRDLASLSCGTLGSLASAGNTSLPAEPLVSLDRTLNGPRGGLLVGLLACVRPTTSPALGTVALASFPTTQPGCWYGCGGESGDYVPASQLLAPHAADAIIGTTAVNSLDQLVLLADNNSVNPLVLAASYVADHAMTAVHGVEDRNAPQISNVLPLAGTVTTSATIQVSANVSDRTLASFTVNGLSAPFRMGADGTMFVGPVTATLSNGPNVIQLAATDAAGNVGTASVTVTANLPLPAPSPTPTPAITPSPIPSPIPSPSPAAVGVTGVDPLCTSGSYAPKATLKIGYAYNPLDGNYTRVLATLSAAGITPTLYAPADVAALTPIADGNTVLLVSRVATMGTLTPAYVAGIRAFIANGGSILGEYDGAALFFTNFVQPTSVITNFNPSFGLLSGTVTGGGGLLPLVNSTIYVTDPNDPLMAGLPASFMPGALAGFAITSFNTSWLHQSASFTSAGFQGLVPVGTFPAIMSGRCGQGRVALYTTSTLTYTNANTSILLRNTFSWLVGP